MSVEALIQFNLEKSYLFTGSRTEKLTGFVRNSPAWRRDSTQTHSRTR